MVTHHGLPLAGDAIAQFKTQDYEGALELVVLDNGEERVENLCDDPRIVYAHEEPHKLSLGKLRNNAHALSTGDITIEWDDDDWRAPGYVTALVWALLDNPHAHFSSMQGPYRVQFLSSGEMWLWNVRFLHDGTLAIWRYHWEPFIEGTPTGEKSEYVLGKINGKPKHPGVGVGRPELFIYRLHDHNNWAAREKFKDLSPVPMNLRQSVPAGSVFPSLPQSVRAERARNAVQVPGQRPRHHAHVHRRRA